MRIHVHTRSRRHESIETYAHKHRSNLMARALACGAVLLRGWGASVESFSQIGTSLGLHPYLQMGAAPRTAVAQHVFTANDSPPHTRIPFHHELGQSMNPPSHVLFYCVTPPRAGGRTPLVSSRDVASYVAQEHPELVRKASDGIVYIRRLPKLADTSSPIGGSWLDTIGRSRREVESRLSASGASYGWENDTLVMTSPPIPLLRTDRSGQSVFYNSLIAAATGWNDDRNVGARCVTFADGTPVDQEVVRDIASYMQDTQDTFDWRKGDLLIIDNSATMHSREPFTPPRTILASMYTSPPRSTQQCDRSQRT